MLEPFAKVRVYVSLGRQSADQQFRQHYSSGARTHGTYISNSEQAVLGIPDNDTEDSSFEYPNEIETAAHHTIQLFGGGVDVDIGRMIALPPRINVFTFGTPTSSVSLPMQFIRGGKGFAVLVECEIVHVALTLKNGLLTPQTQRPSIMISTRPVFVTTTEGYRDCGTERWIVQELGRSDGPKMKLAPYSPPVIWVESPPLLRRKGPVMRLWDSA